MGTQHHTLCAGGTPRVETSKNMNVEGEQNASASAPASPTPASTAAVQQAPQITSFFQLERTSPTQATPATSPRPAAADLPAAAAAGTNMTAPAPPHQQRLNSTRSVSVSPPKHDLWVLGGYHTPWFITPPHLSHPQTHPVGVRTCYHTPWFITPPHLSHPQTYRVGGRTCYHIPWFNTPWGPPRPALYHRGYTRYHIPHRIPHPVIIFSSAQIYHRGCVI